MNQEQLEKAKKLFFILLSVDIVINAIAGFNCFSTVEILKNVQAGTRSLDQALINSVDFWDKFSMLTMLTLIGVGLGLVKWLNSCYHFAKESIGATGFKNEKWTVAGWIIPVFNLFKPYQVINEIYKAGSSNYSKADDWKKENGSWLLLTWWIFWAVTHFFMWIFGKEILKKSLRGDLTLSQAIGIYEIQAWLFVFSIIVAALWFIVAGKLTQRFFNRSTKTNRNIISTDDDHSYKTAYEEMSSGQFQTATWAKAFANAEGNQDKAKALYIKYRVEQLGILPVEKLQTNALEKIEIPVQPEVKFISFDAWKKSIDKAENKQHKEFFAIIVLVGLLGFFYQKHESSTNNKPQSAVQSYPPQLKKLPAGRLRVITDLFDAEIDIVGGDLRRVGLRTYPASEQHMDQPLLMLNDGGTAIFIAQSGLLERNKGPAPNHYAPFTAEQSEYWLADGQDTLEVRLNWSDPSGVKVAKIYTFRRGSFLAELNQQIENKSVNDWQGSQYRQFQFLPNDNNSVGDKAVTYTDVALSSTERRYEKFAFDNIAKNERDQIIKGGWIAAVQHYFLSAWILDPSETNQFYTRILSNNRYIIGMTSAEKTIPVGTTGDFRTGLYIGPKLPKVLETIAPNLQLTID